MSMYLIGTSKDGSVVSIADDKLICDMAPKTGDSEDCWECAIEDLEHHIANYKKSVVQSFVDNKWPDCNYSVIAASGKPSSDYEGLILLRDFGYDICRLAWFWDSGNCYDSIKFKFDSTTKEFFKTLAALINMKGE